MRIKFHYANGNETGTTDTNLPIDDRIEWANTVFHLAGIQDGTAHYQEVRQVRATEKT